MKLERIILSLAVFLMAAGCLIWLLGGAAALRSYGLWFWFGAFGVLSLPLIVSLIYLIVKRGRD
jgi:hypothetical protein